MRFSKLKFLIFSIHSIRLSTVVKINTSYYLHSLDFRGFCSRKLGGIVLEIAHVKVYFTKIPIQKLMIIEVGVYENAFVKDGLHTA